MNNSRSSEFSAEKFVDHLLNEGTKVPLETFKRIEVPTYYDERIYKRGQAFFHDNIFGLMFAKFIGLITVIALPDGLKVLRMTKKTGSDMAAYRRYMVTVFHVLSWYDLDFKPGSMFLASLEDVKEKHNAASKRASIKLNHRFNQMDMALTQFGFMGFAVIRGEMLGIHNPKEEDLRGFVHVWRVLGYILGIEDRFNICRVSLQETKEICSILAKKVFTPLFEKPDRALVEMTHYIVNGMACLDPLIDYHFCMTYLQMLLENQQDYKKLENQNYRDISWFVKLKLLGLSILMHWSKLKFVRICTKYSCNFKLWFVKVFPIMAYIKYGLQKGHVDFLKIIYKPEKISSYRIR